MTAAPAPLLTPARERAMLWLLALTQFTVIMDFMVMMPLAPQLMQAFAIGPAAVSGAVSAYAWCAGLSGLLAATYIDRFDRKKLHSITPEGLAFLEANRAYVDAIAARVDAPAGADDDLRHLMHELKAAVLARARAGDVDGVRLDAIRAILRQARADIEALA